MRARYRNVGAPFTSEDGQWVDTGQVFEPTERDLARRAYKLRFVEHVKAKAKAEPKAKDAPRVLPEHPEASSRGEE